MKNAKQAPRPTFQYYPATSDHTGITLQLHSLADMIRFAEQHSIRAVFVLGAPEQPRFAIFRDGTTVMRATEGYLTLEDYSAATHAGFPDAATYYAATADGYNSYEDYKIVQAIGIPDKKIYETIREKGYLEGFEAYTALLADTGDGMPSLPDIGAVRNALELFHYAQEAGFTDYAGFIATLKTGFTTAGMYSAAQERGFTERPTYEDAIARGFATFADYAFAREHSLRDSTDARNFIAMATTGAKAQAHDERILLSILSMTGERRRISINKLSGLFRTELDTFRYMDTGALPAWFTTAIEGTEGLIHYLATADEVKQYGTWDKDGEFFEIARLQARKVVIDGSNVAHNTVKGSGRPPQVANIIRLVSFLKERGFEEITVIVDASLRHKLADPEAIDTLRNTAIYYEAPAETSADAFLIQQVKNERSLLITNDTFRDWKMKDPWVANYIDHYRLTFLIAEHEVLMPDLKQIF